MKENTIKIYGKEYIESYFENVEERENFVNSLANEFNGEYAKINVVPLSDKLLTVRINLQDKSISRIYKKDRKYVELDNIFEDNELILKLLAMSNDETFQQIEYKENRNFKDNYGKYITSLKDFIIPNKTLKMIQDYMYSGHNVLLKGGPGTGKTDFPQRFAQKIGMEYLVIDCGTIKTPQDWFGTREYVEGEGTKFIPSELVEYLQQPSIIILDEINRTTPDCHNSIFRILDGNRKVHITALKKTIDVHPHCIIMATMNEGRSHTGTYMLDSAITDRFECFTLELPNLNNIKKILSSKQPTLTEEYIEAIGKITTKLNSLYISENVTVQVGLRPALSAALLLSKNNKFIDVLEQTFANRFSDEGGVDSERVLVKQTISGMIPKELLNSTVA